MSAAGRASPHPSHPYAGRFETKKGEVYRGLALILIISTRPVPGLSLACIAQAFMVSCE